jgi:hypothetical protein
VKEHEWRTSADGDALVRYWGSKFTERTARLLMLACCQRVRRFFRHDALASALQRLERHYANPDKPNEPFEGDAARRAYRACNRIASGRVRDPGRGVAFGVLAAVEPNSIADELEEDFAFLTYSCAHDISDGFADGAEADEGAAQADIVREILGNVFRPVTFDARWRTSDAVALARQMYKTQKFGAMPILADALQEAGCEDEQVLAHCRDTALAHRRGCWVLDAVLGAR